MNDELPLRVRSGAAEIVPVMRGLWSPRWRDKRASNGLFNRATSEAADCRG
jgi:hypothetical protein